jgi:hypothetical protein
MQAMNTNHLKAIQFSIQNSAGFGHDCGFWLPGLASGISDDKIAHSAQ